MPCESRSIHQSTDVDGPGPTPLLHQLFGLHTTPQPTHGTLAGRQPTASLPGAAMATGLPNLSSGATGTPVGSASANPDAHCDPDAMDTTSPSRAVIFQAPPGSRKNQLSFYRALPGSGNTPPTGSTAWAHGSTTLPQKPASTQTPVSKRSNAGIASQPTLEVTVGNSLTIPTCWEKQ